MFAFVTFAFLAIPLLSTAQLVPTGPGPNEVFKQGTPCTISWNPDTSGKWKTTFIELMTGPNQPMVHLATVAMVDGTDPSKTSMAIPCPAVSPNAPIYFYQFTAQNQNTTWTGRFSISDPSGATSTPPNANQPDGEAIPWGSGKLLDSSQGSPPPPTAPSGQVDGSGAGSPNGGSSAPVLTASAPSNSSAPPASGVTPSSTSAHLTASPLPPASTSGLSTAQVAATALSAPAAASTGSISSHNNSAIANSLSASPAFVAAAVLGLVTLY